MAETLALLALEKGVEVGAIGFKEARELFKETWQKAFPEFDVEKVFFRCIYTTGGLFVAKIVYDLYVQFRMLTAKPAEWVEQVTAKYPITKWVISPLAASVEWLTMAVLKALFPKKMEESEKEYEQAMEKERVKLLEELGIPVWLDDLFGKHFFLVLAGANGWWIFSEYRNYRKLKDLSMKIL